MMQLTAALYISLLATLSTLVHASLNLSDIQTLVGFPQACTDAYNTPIDACNDAHFRSGALCSCSSACSSALDSMTNTIIDACQNTAASPDSLIGLFFDHAATRFLCSPPAHDGGGGCGSGTAEWKLHKQQQQFGDEFKHRLNTDIFIHTINQANYIDISRAFLNSIDTVIHVADFILHHPQREQRNKHSYHHKPTKADKRWRQPLRHHQQRGRDKMGPADADANASTSPPAHFSHPQFRIVISSPKTQQTGDRSSLFFALHPIA